MLAKVLSDVLNAHLGTFIENLDTNQLGTSIYRGELELKNMKLKKTMFKDSPLPFDLAYGHVGRIYLKIPIWDMFTSPLIIVVEDVFGLVKIKPTDEWKPNLQKQAYNDLVAEVLHQFELFVKNKEILAEKEKENTQSQSSATFGEKFIARIIDNIQISIRHIYFRFEDKMSGTHQHESAQEKFAIGVRLKEFSVFTSDESFKQITQDAADTVHTDAKDKDLTYKVAAIDGFSVFCDWHQIDLECNGGIDLKQLEDIKDQADPNNYFYKILAGEFSTNALDRVKTHKYLIDGFKVSLHLKLNKNIKFPSMPASLDHPQIWAEIIIGDEAQIKKRSEKDGTNHQYHHQHDDHGRSCQKHGNENALLLSIYQPQILRILKTLEIIGFFNEFRDGALNEFITRKLKPDEKKEYLNYYTAWRTLEDSVKDQDVKTFAELREQMRKIENLTNDAELIAVRQTGINILKTTRGEQKEKTEILKKIQAEIDERVGYGLFISREQRQQTETEIRQKYQTQLSALESKYKTERMGNLLKDSLKNLHAQERKDDQAQAADEEEKTVEQMDYDIEYNKLPMNYVLYQIDIKIPGIDFTIDNEFNQKLLIFNLDQFELNFKQSKQTMNVNIKLEDFEIKDNWSESTVHPRLIEALEHENQFLQMMDEQDQQEVDKDLLQDILKDEKRHMRAQALKINYIADTSFKKCPFKLRVRVEKQLQIIFLIPLINELQRTMDAAFSDQKLDFEYFQKYAQGRVKEFTDVAQTYAESIKKGDYQHTNADIDIKMYAPVLKIPENIFKEDSPYLEFNTGTLKVRSDLLEFDRVNPNKYETIENDLELYDKYTINLEKLRLNLIFPGAVGNKKEIKIINDFTFCITVENCLAPLHKKFPTLRLDIDFKERIEFEFDFHCLKTIFRLKDLLLIQLDTSDLQMVEQKMRKKMEIVKKKAQIQNMRRTAAYAQSAAMIAKAGAVAEAPAGGPEARWRMLRQRSRLLQLQQQRAQSSKAKLDQSQQNGQHVEIHDQVIHEAYSERSQSSAGSQGVTGLVDHENKVSIPALFQGNEALSSQDGGPSKAINAQAQVNEEGKKAKFLREQAEKSSNQGANMEINFSMKEMLLILKADSISKSASIDKSAAESPLKHKNSEAPFNNNVNKNTFKRAKQPSSKGMAPPNHKQYNSNEFGSGLNGDGLHNDAESYSVTFEMRGLMTKIKLENNQNDVAVDFSVDTFQIKDSQSAHAKRAQRKEQRITKQEQQQLQILNKIMSSPLDDYEIIAGEQMDDDESLSEDSIIPEQDVGRMKDKKADQSRVVKSQHINGNQGFAGRQEQQQANSTDEKELYVQCIMKSSQYWDDDYEEVVENSLMEVTCCINRSRLIVNIPTVSNFIKIYKQLMDFLDKSPKNYDQLVIDNKNNMMKALALQSFSHQSADAKEAYPLIKKIFMNLARQNGHHESAEISDYLSMVADCLKETIEAKIWQSDIRKELQQSEVAQIERDINEHSRKSDLEKNESSPSSDNEQNQHGNAAQSGSEPGRALIEKDQKFAAELKRHNLGQPEKLPDHSGFIRSRAHINDSSASEERLAELVLEQNQTHTRQQSTTKPLAKKLYFVKETYWRYVMSVKVKLKNMELWITDYNNEPEKKAQILQLKFMSDLFYDSDQFGKEVHCSKKPLKQLAGLAVPPYNHESMTSSLPTASAQLPNDKQLSDEVEDDLDDEKLEELDQGLLRMLNEEQTEIQEEYHVIRKVLESKDHMQFNLSKLAIEQMIVQRWLEVSFIVWHLRDHAQQAENAVDRDEQQKMNTNTSITSLSESLEDEGDGSIDKEESGDDSSHSVSEHLSHSHSDFEFRRNIEGVQFAQCPILKPTCVSILMKNESEYQECRFYMMNIDLENLFLTCDFKDIDLMYYLYKRYEQCIWPELELLTPEVVVEDEGGQVEDKENEKEQNHDQETQKRGQNPAPKNALGENRSDLVASRYEGNGEQLIEKGKSVKVVLKANGEHPTMKNNQADAAVSEEGNETPPDSEDDEDYELGDLVHSSSVETFKTDISNVAVKISSIVLSLSDGELENYLGSKTAWPTPMIELVINKLEYYQKSNITIGNKPRSKDVLAVPLDIYYGMGDFHQPVSDMKVSCGLYATYYNVMSQAFEPFIEPWSLNIKILQISEDDIQDIEIKSDQFLAINFTFGMALTIRDIRNRITDKTFKIDEELKKEKEKNQKKENENKNTMNLSMSEHNTIQPWNGHEKLQENLKSENAQHTKTNMHMQQTQTQQPSLKQNKKNGYTFYNYLGGDVEFCVSDKELDENLAIKMAGGEERDQRLRRLKNIQRQTTESLGNYKICVGGERQNDEKQISTISKDQAFFDIQKQNIQKRRQNQVHDTDAYFNDDIENEPLTIDIKIEGITKIVNIPIEIVGVYSYSATTVINMMVERCASLFASEPEQQLEKQQMKQNQEGIGLVAKQRIPQPLPTLPAHDINIIVNINTEGKQRIINFESQLLFVNNMSYHITLLFRLRRLCSHASATKSPTKKAAMLSRHSEKPQQHLNMAPNNQRVRPSSTLQMKYHVEADMGKHSVAQKVVQLEDGDAEAEKTAAASRGPRSAEQLSSANPAKHRRVNGLEQTKLDERRRSLHQQAHEDFEAAERGPPGNISKSPDWHEQASDEASFDYEEDDKRVEMEEERANSTVTVTLQPHDIYKIPLMWMMPESAVDVAIVKKRLTSVQGTKPREYEDREDADEQIFEDIQKIFRKTASDQKKPTFTDQIESRIIELDSDFYVSIDIQGYCCFPKQTQKTNPLQYVVSLNPPLMLTNYSMSPLELFEIDKPETPDAVAVSQARIAPAMSAHIIELDLTEENESHIKLTFADTVKNQLLSTTIQKFSIPKARAENLVDDKRQKSEQRRFKRYNDEVEYDNSDENGKMEDGTTLELCQMQVDTIQRVYSDIKAYHENFNFRTKLIDISIAVKIMIYPKFMIVNKSMHDIMIKGQTIKKKMNDFLFDNSDSQKFVFRVQGYKESMPIDIEAIGVSGEVMIDHEQHDGKYTGKQLQFGINISQAQWPFNKTTIVTIVPRYLVVNKLKRTIQVRQVANAYMQNQGKITTKDQQEMHTSIKTLEQGQTDEFHLMKSKQSSNKNKENKIQFRTLRATTDQRDIYEHSFADAADDCEEDQINSASFKAGLDPQWTTPFSIDALEDFQTETQLKAPGSRPDLQQQVRIQRLEGQEQKQVDGFQVEHAAVRPNESQMIIKQIEQHLHQQHQELVLQWFQPQEYNNYKLFTRVIVTENPLDNNATRLIIFDEPAIEEYVIKNKTKFEIVFVKWDDSAGKSLSPHPITLAADKKMAYTWDHRELALKNIRVEILDHTSVIPIDKCSETSRTTGKLIKNSLFRTEQYVFQSFVQFNSQGSTKILSITQSDNKPQFSQMISWPHQRNKYAAKDDEHDLCPDSEKEHEAEEENHDLKKEGYKLHADFKGIGFTFIDNVPKELLFMCFNRLVINYTQVTQTSKMEDGINESTNTKTDIKLTLENFQIDNLVDEEMPVLLGAQKYYSRNLERQCRANVESNLSKFYRFIPEDDEWFSKSKKPKKAKESTTKRSEALAKKMASTEHQQDGYDGPVPFVKVVVESSQKTHAGKLGTILRYEKITFGIQEFFLQIESAIMNENFKLIMDIIDIFSESGEEDIMTNDEEYEKSLHMFRRDQCNLVDASQGVVFDASSIKVDKITFGVIQIAAIRISLTFKLKLQMLDFDIANPRALFGVMNIIYPFLSQLASITDARIRFNELIILEGFYSQEQLAKNIQSSYYNQGIRQFFKILGSSDIMGNPTGLIDKVGLGVIELARDPIEGIQQGPEAFLTGLRTGVQGIIKGVIGGSFESLSLISGSLYDVVKQTSGNEDTRNENATNIVDGVYYGIKGIGIEVYQGARGLIVKPWEGYKQGGKKGLVKGLGAGLAGAATTPVTGVLRAGQSVSQGISGTANDIGNIGKTRLEKLDVKLFRNRPPRRIDLRGQIRVYNEDMAIINRLLTKIKLANETLFQNQIIRFYALVPSIDQYGQIKQNLKYLIVITNQYLIYFEVFNFLDLQVKKYLQKSLILSEELSNIVSYNIKKRPSHITQPDDKATSRNQVAMYVKPQYFLTIVFKKPNAKNSTQSHSEAKGPEAHMHSSQKHWEPAPKAGAVRMAPGPRAAGLALAVIEEEKEDHGHAPFERLSQRDKEGNNRGAAPQRDGRGQQDQPDGAGGLAENHYYSQASYASRSLSKQDFNMSHMGAPSEDALVEDRDSKAKYRYIFFSPSIEIFNRMHQIFTTLPEIHENIHEVQREKAERLATRQAQKNGKPKKANYFN